VVGAPRLATSPAAALEAPDAKASDMSAENTTGGRVTDDEGMAGGSSKEGLAYQIPRRDDKDFNRIAGQFY
jgi:hypothetical protein